MSWLKSAACGPENADLFFPVGSSAPAMRQIEKAKDVCRSRCPVMTQCRTWAFESGENWGVWGGLSEDERRYIRRQAVAGHARNSDD
ncbi:WhiB family transcriptional regulator [Streptomyces sp. NPDC021100]|uniref:WhiB family transcriptional regulator n=1 Tax=Streptomyces sp. NPDC021100 TaxID=3365114 RepID=UPI0037BC84D5